MAIGTTAALIALGVGAAAGGAYAAKKGSDSSNEAAQLESDSAAQALAVQERMYRQQREDNDPYLSAGRQALGRLGDMSGATRGWTFDPNNASTWAGPPKPRLMGYGQSEGPPGGFQTGRALSLGQLGAPGSQPGGVHAGPDERLGGQPPTQPPVSGPSTPPPRPDSPQSGTVLMQSPDGEQRRIPANLAAQFEARGARRVS